MGYRITHCRRIGELAAAVTGKPLEECAEEMADPSALDGAFIGHGN